MNLRKKIDEEIREMIDWYAAGCPGGLGGLWIQKKPEEEIAAVEERD
jgi:hypothetical protein